MTPDKYEHWLPSKWGHDEALEEMGDVTEAVGMQAQAQYMEEREREANRMFAEIMQEFSVSLARAKLNFEGELSAKLEAMLHEKDFLHMANKLKQEASTYYMVPFKDL